MQINSYGQSLLEEVLNLFALGEGKFLSLKNSWHAFLSRIKCLDFKPFSDEINMVMKLILQHGLSLTLPTSGANDYTTWLIIGGLVFQ